MALSEDEKLALSQFTSSDLYRRAKEEILSISTQPSTLLTGGMLAPEVAIALAAEKGIQNAFRALELLSRPSASIQNPPTHKPLRTTKQ